MNRQNLYNKKVVEKIEIHKNITMKKYTVHIVWLVVAIVALGGGYYWGKAGAAGARGAGRLAGAYGSSTRSFAGGAAGGGLAVGQISAIDSSDITLQLANGNSQVVFYSSSTQISEPTIVPPSALSVGTNVMVGGTTNSDGSLTAQSIQVRSANAGAGGGRGASNAASGQ
jgi:hypothetical protein